MARSIPRWPLLTALAATLTIAGCGTDNDAPTATDDPVLVSAAASLKTAFTAYGTAFDAGDVRLSFAGSDVLAAQIRQGARPDVFAAANTKLPQELYVAGLVEAPTVFAGNRLVLAVPKDSEIDDLQDVAASGTQVAIGSQSVPVGAYTRKILSKLPDAQADGILGNVRSEEPDVKGIIGKLTQGAVDAGFVYITDVTAAGDDLRAVELPANLEPSAAYGVAVVKGAKNPAGAQAFVDGLISGAGQQALQAAGFEPPPGE